LWENFEKRLEKQAIESLECCKQSLIGYSGGAQKTGMLTGIWIVKVRLMRFQMRRRKDSIGIWTRSHPCQSLAKNLSTFCPCPKTLGKAHNDLKVMD
jgi:hypothetical protein